jgi:hypothetical protein
MCQVLAGSFYERQVNPGLSVIVCSSGVTRRDQRSKIAGPWESATYLREHERLTARGCQEQVACSGDRRKAVLRVRQHYNDGCQAVIGPRKSVSKGFWA